MATAPLDLIRIRRQLAVGNIHHRHQMTHNTTESILQSWRTIVANEGGVKALFRGNLSAVYLWISYSAVQFSLYTSTKEQLHEILRNMRLSKHYNANQLSSLVAFVAGATAGSCATLATYPFDVTRTAFAARGKVVTTIMQQQHFTPQQVPFSSLIDPSYQRPNFVQAAVSLSSTRLLPPTSLAQFVKQLYQQQGFRGFYAGVGPAIVQIIPYMGVNFTIYEYLTRTNNVLESALAKISTRTLDNPHAFPQGLVLVSACAGSISGAVSKMLVYPLDTVKRRLQGQALSVLLVESPLPGGTSDGRTTYQSPHYRNMIHCMVTMYRGEGYLAFYKGMAPAVYKSTIATALSFAVFQWTKHALHTSSV
jgi:solute carrier family 25 thiamine pyrophosphate transporter 19